MDVGVLHPGEIGAAAGTTLVGGDHIARWVNTGRSVETAARAGAGHLVAVGSVADVMFPTVTDLAAELGVRSDTLALLRALRAHFLSRADSWRLPPSGTFLGIL